MFKVFELIKNFFHEPEKPQEMDVGLLNYMLRGG
jgi:hypothetical protein